MRYFGILLSVSTVSTVCTSEPSASSGRFSSIFFWKNYCGAPGLWMFAIFATIHLHPLYFEVHIFSDPPDPPICLKMPKCANFGLFWSFHFKDTPKVGVHREKFNIGNVAQIFFGGFYICWDYVISFSQHFPMKNFSPSPSTSPSPESHELFEFWLLVGN